MTLKRFLEIENIYPEDFSDIPQNTPVKLIPGYFVKDDGCEIHFPNAVSHEDAATEFVEGGDWGNKWQRLHLKIYKIAETEDFNIFYDHKNIEKIIQPKEPECVESEHDWQSPHHLVGGLKENPGVYAHGGGVIIYTVCKHCGYYRVYDTWGQDPYDGSQGHLVIKYMDPDNDSLKWANQQQEEC